MSITIDHERGEVSVSGKQIRLTNKEYQILRILKWADGKIVTRETFLEKIWGYDLHARSTIDKKTVDQHVSRLRHQLGRISKTTRSKIVTVPKRGYKLVG